MNHASISGSDRGPAVLVTGGTGFIGSALVRQLLGQGRQVIVYSRDATRARHALGPGPRVVDTLDDIPDDTHIDAIVHLAGATVLGMPWTRSRREVLLRSRTGVMQGLLGLMRRLHQPPRLLVAASAVGYYGVPTSDDPVDEQAGPQPGRFQSDLCAAIESEAQLAKALHVRVVRMRFGIVLGSHGGAYPPLAVASRLGLGSQLGDGKQPVPWIHLDDAVGLTLFSIEQEGVSGALNAVAPEVPTQSAFAREMAASVGRRVFLRVPGLVLRVALGEMSELLLCGQHAVPAAAVAAGYRFKASSVREAMTLLA